MRKTAEQFNSSRLAAHPLVCKARTKVGMLLILALCVTPWAAAQSVLTYHNDNGRTGQNLSETTLNPSNVNSTTFGKLFLLTTDGKVDAEPLFVPSLTINGAVHNVVFVESENDSAYAFDADT